MTLTLIVRVFSSLGSVDFVSDYRDCMQRLRKINARLADNEDALRTLLLVAICDNDFECVRNDIIRTPGMSVEAILSDIHEREKALTMMKERESHHIGGDGMSTSRHSQQTQQSNNRNDGGSRGGNDSTATKSGGRWNIPRFPVPGSSLLVLQSLSC
jgi:hypothetical protein